MHQKDLLGSHKATMILPIAGATAGTDFAVPAFRAPFNLTVIAARFLPAAALTGATATETTLALLNRGAAGDGTDVVASNSFVTNENAVAFVPYDLTLGAGVDVDEGHIVSVVKTHTSTGTAISGAVEIEFVSRGS